MKKMNLIILLVANFLLTSYAVAGLDFPEIADRCVESNLSIPQAHGRNAWALKCKNSLRSVSGQVIPSLEQLIRESDAKRPNPYYALVSDVSEEKWDAPTSTEKGCDVYTRVHAFCESACFTPDVEILFEDGYTPIAKAAKMRKTGIKTLLKDSTIDDLVFGVLPVASYSKSIRKANEEIRRIEMSGGEILTVTLNHPILLGKDSFDGKYKSGMMVLASDLKEGYVLIKSNGLYDAIKKISNYNFYGKVYNISPESEDTSENIIVANGLLVGSARYQYSEIFKDMMYRQLLRSVIDVESLSARDAI